GPFARDHLRQILGLERIAAAGFERVDRALRQQWTKPEGYVGGVPDLADGRRDDLGQSLPAKRLIARQRTPAALGELTVRIAKARRSCHSSVRKFRTCLIA